VLTDPDWMRMLLQENAAELELSLIHI